MNLPDSLMQANQKKVTSKTNDEIVQQKIKELDK
jgi:hypothetical protein